MKEKRWWLLGIVGLLVGLGLLWKFGFARSNYEVIHPKKGDLTEAIYGLGKVKSDRTYEVKLGVTGLVSRLSVKEGDPVKKGQELLMLDSVVLRAPFDGTVTKVAANPGELVPPQMVILRVDDLKDRLIELSLEQEGALRVRPGQKAKVSFENLRAEVVEGEVTALFTRDDDFVARIQVKGLSESVLPGMTADVSVEVGTIKDAKLIPVRALTNGMVLVAKKGQKAEKLKIPIGHVDGQWAEVKDDSLAWEDEIYLPAVRK